MKKSLVLASVLALVLSVVAMAQAETNFTTIAWSEYSVRDGSYNFDGWTNAWKDGHFGLFAYGQAGHPSYAQTYGGVAARVNHLEGGAGLGFESINGDVGLRKSVYAVAYAGQVLSLNYYETSHAGGWWFVSQDFYSVTPKYDIGFRVQRFLGGGPAVRSKIMVGKTKIIPGVALMFNGDQINPVCGLTVIH